MTMLVEELKQFTPPDTSIFKHATRTVKVPELAEVFSQNLVLLENNGVYEPVQVNRQTNTITHFILSSGEETGNVSIVPYWLNYIRTGNTSIINNTLTEKPHEIPLPTYPITKIGNGWAPCVKLKSGVKALIVNNEVIEGVEI